MLRQAPDGAWRMPRLRPVPRESADSDTGVLLAPREGTWREGDDGAAVGRSVGLLTTVSLKELRPRLVGGPRGPRPRRGSEWKGGRWVLVGRPLGNSRLVAVGGPLRSSTPAGNNNMEVHAPSHPQISHRCPSLATAHEDLDWSAAQRTAAFGPAATQFRCRCLGICPTWTGPCHDAPWQMRCQPAQEPPADAGLEKPYRSPVPGCWI